MATKPRGDAAGATGAASEGLSALRYQALNKDSYHLDSPPFTGAAVTGAGPVTQGLEQPVPNTIRTAAGVSHAREPRKTPYDSDVPRWALDSRQSREPEELDEELDESQAGAEAHEATRSPYTAPVPRQGESMETYEFPRHRFATKMRDETKQPLVVVACGSFSPPTYLHLDVDD